MKRIPVVQNGRTLSKGIPIDYPCCAEETRALTALISSGLSVCCAHVVFQKAVENSYEIICSDMFLNRRRLRIVVVYRAPGCNVIKTEQLISALSDLLSCNSTCIVCGDFNFSDINWRESENTAVSSISKDFVSFCKIHGLTQTVRNPTLASNVLDLVLSNEPNFVYHTVVEPPLGTSDHAVVRFTLNCTIAPADSEVFIRDYKRANFDEICTYLSGVDWYGSLNSVDSVNDKYEMFLSILNDSIALFVPQLRVSSYRMPLPGYLRSMFRRKSDAWMAANACNEANKRSLMEKFKTLNERFEKKLRKYYSSVERKIVEVGNRQRFF